jgi:hypothetical protein
MRRGCLVEGCPEPYRAKGYCNLHYKRWMKTGDPGPIGRVRVSRPIPDNVHFEGGKVCNRCLVPQALDNFYDDKRALSDGKRGHCKKCHSKESYASRKKHGRVPTSEQARDITLRRNHGITKVEYDLMVEEQGGLCASCGGPPTIVGGTVKGTIRLVVDHNHTSGSVRGLLCNGCNLGLGHFRDDPARLRMAAEYLERVGTYACPLPERPENV